MQKLILLACLAATASASSVALTDPAKVAADWNKTLDAARQPMLPSGPLGLTSSGQGTLNFRANTVIPPDPGFGARPATPTEASATFLPKEARHEVPAESKGLDPKMLHPGSGDMDPKMLHARSGDMDPKILLNANARKPRTVKPQPPVGPDVPLLPDGPAEPAVPENK